MWGYIGKLLVVDLTWRTSRVIPVPQDWIQGFVGGKGFGVRLLTDMIPAKADPLGPDNVLAILTGPLTGTAAPAMRGCVVTKSPLTGMFNDSYFGGEFSPELKYAGYDGVIVRGVSDKPVYVTILDGEVRIDDAGDLWGLDTYQTYKVLKAKLGKDVRVACIGPAGENRVKFACVDCDPHRQAGRGGSGAVMGSKNLKAFAVRGRGLVRVLDQVKLSEAIAQARQAMRPHPAITELNEMGTVGGVGMAMEFGFFPIRNFGGDGYASTAEVGPPAHAARLWLRNKACFGCPIACGRMAVSRRGRYRGTIGDIVEYETLGMVGANLLVKDLEVLHYLNWLIDGLGLDSITTGACLAYAAEAKEKGLIGQADFPVSFGDSASVISGVEMIARREGLGNILAEGVAEASRRIEGHDGAFAVHIQGLETPAWDARGSAGLLASYLTGDRGGCHMRGFPVSYELAGKWRGKPVGDPVERAGKAPIAVWEQNQVAALDTLVSCDFTRPAVPIPVYCRMLEAVTGTALSEEEFYEVGERILNASRIFNLREGWTQTTRARLPGRFREPLSFGTAKGNCYTDEDVRLLLRDYNETRGWDAEGRPTPETLARLGLA